MDTIVKVSLSEFSIKYPRFRLAPLSLDFRAGECVAFVGPNGSGKTTTLRALAGLTADYEGSIFLEGTELRDLLPLGRRRIGLLPEQLGGYGWMTVREHFAFLRQFYPCWDAQYAGVLSDRLRVPLDQRLGRLSKGTRVKVAFIAAEAYRPALLLLDEPTSGLDPQVRGDLITAVISAARSRPDCIVIFSTHILEDVEQMADRVLLLAEGQLRMDSSVNALREANNGASLGRILHAALSAAGRREP